MDKYKCNDIIIQASKVFADAGRHFSSPRYAIICGVYISENRALVNVIQVNLPRYMSSWVPEILGYTYILPVILGDGS